MRVFNVNKAMGLASSGVEYAQAYRRDVLAGIPWVDDYYVFTDYMPTNPSVFADRLGFDRSQVRWVYDVVAGRETAPCTVTVDELLTWVTQPHTVTSTGPGLTEVALTGTGLRYRVRTLDGGLVDRVETVAGDRLVRVDHYDRTLHDVEHFHEDRLVRRVVYTPDGRVAAEQLYRDGEITRTLVTPASPLHESAGVRKRGPSSFRGDVVVEGRSRFFQLVFRHLLSRPDDVVVVDRALDVIDGIYPVVGDHRLYSVVHAEHFDLKQVEDGVLLWNNHYENVFTRPDLVDGLVVSTQRQKEALDAHLGSSIPVVCIPVGVAAPPGAHPAYDPFALVTASRLADEKHLDLLVRAVAAARDRVPGVRLDIYGEGNREHVLAVVDQTQTRDCVRLMGHQTLGGVLGTYALYVSASTSEGFGLTLLEAMAEGLPLVGFDVDYGNRELVEPGVNGLLVPHTSTDDDVAGLADAVVRLLTSGSLDAMRAASLRKAEAYSATHVRERWEALLSEEAAC